LISLKKRQKEEKLVSCTPVTATKTSQQRAENSCAPLRTPACGPPSAKGWRIKRREEKNKTEREKETGRRGTKKERQRERGDAFYFKFQRSLNKFALSWAPSTVKKFIGRLHALIGDVYRAAIFSS